MFFCSLRLIIEITFIKLLVKEKYNNYQIIMVLFYESILLISILKIGAFLTINDIYHILLHTYEIFQTENGKIN